MTSVRMADELMEKLESTADKLQRSKSWVINDAVREYLAKEEVKTQRLLETQEALQDMQAGRVGDQGDGVHGFEFAAVVVQGIFGAETIRDRPR